MHSLRLPPFAPFLRVKSVLSVSAVTSCVAPRRDEKKSDSQDERTYGNTDAQRSLKPTQGAAFLKYGGSFNAAS